MDASTAPHPDSLLRIVSAVHRFPIPRINPDDALSYAESFTWCASGSQTTQAAMSLADDSRRFIKNNMADGRQSHTSLARALQDYIPLMNQILLSVKVQPEVARLDKPLKFSWSSGLEQPELKKKPCFDSEALMFELVLSLNTYALSEANLGCDSCATGDFADASRHFSKTAGVFKYLGDDLLPSWAMNNRGPSEMAALAETKTGVAEVFAVLFQATSQQMAVATVLAKPGVPNYALVGKLCLGIADDLDSFLAKAPAQMQRMDPGFLKLIAFSASVQRPLSLYFLARGLWNSSEYGVAISALKEAWSTITTQTQPRLAGRAIPEIQFTGGLLAMRDEVTGFKQHVNALLQSWEKENAQIYFEEVPHAVPKNKALKAIHLKKAEEFVLGPRDPLPFGPPPVAAGQKGGTARPSKSNILLWWKEFPGKQKQ